MIWPGQTSYAIQIDLYLKRADLRYVKSLFRWYVILIFDK